MLLVFFLHILIRFFRFGKGIWLLVLSRFFKLLYYIQTFLVFNTRNLCFFFSKTFRHLILGAGASSNFYFLSQVYLPRHAHTLKSQKNMEDGVYLSLGGSSILGILSYIVAVMITKMEELLGKNPESLRPPSLIKKFQLQIFLRAV